MVQIVLVIDAQQEFDFNKMHLSDCRLSLWLIGQRQPETSLFPEAGRTWKVSFSQFMKCSSTFVVRVYYILRMNRL